MSEGQLELWVCSWENCPVQRQAKSPRESKLLTGLFCTISKACHSKIGLGKLSPRVNAEQVQVFG